MPMYFTDAHEELRLHIRKFLEKEVRPHLEEWEEKTFPDYARACAWEKANLDRLLRS